MNSAPNPYLYGYGPQYGTHPYRPMPVHVGAPKTWPIERTMPARLREIGAVVALVVAADFALWRGKDLAPGGYSAAAFFVAVPTILLVAARARRVTARLGVVIALLAAIALRCAYAPTVGTVLLGIAGMFVLAITMRTRSSSLIDIGGSFTATFTSLPQRLQAFFGGVARRFGAKRDGTNDSGTIAVPVLLVATFIGIFALANPLVARGLGFLTEATFPSFARIMTALGLGFGAILLARPALFRSKLTEDTDTTLECTPRGLRMARNALLPLNVVFLAYNALDAAYLWAGAPPPNMTERQYAHEGAAWLTVAIVVLNVAVGVMFRGALAHDPQAKRVRVLAYAWLGQGLVLALGTFRRLSIHIATSGLSNLRILGIFGTALVTFGIVLVGMKLTRQRSFTWLVRRQLDALALATLTFSLLPTHRVSAPVNVSRAMAHEYQALVNVEEQAAEPESAVHLLPLLDHDDERIRRGVAALLLNERDALRAQAKKSQRWADRDLASAMALRGLEAATPRLDAVLGDVERPAAIQPFEYIRNSSIEGAIAQTEISRVELAQTRSQLLVQRWADAHTPGSSRGAHDLDVVYADTVVIDGVARSSQKIIESKRAFALNAPPDYTFVVASPITILELGVPARGGAERVEARVKIAQSTNGDAPKLVDCTLVLERRADVIWKIIEERGAGVARF
ncbi:MAG: DUF4173 domain-containing protein [Deltaproteobacteria bacterium]|nr:DUF4173 domain-containing protein [Deltaproteobacteria bacterium]